MDIGPLHSAKLSGNLPDSMLQRLILHQHVWRPFTDVYETEDSLVVRVEVAGMQEDGFEIQLDGRILTIRGIRPDIQERRAYYQVEIHFGEFLIEVGLPPAYNAEVVDAERIEAEYENGFLRVVLPKARPRQISIEED